MTDFSNYPVTEVDAVVIGGGLSGLVAAYELTRQGLRPVVLEARGYTGGLIAGSELGGVEFDIGAESFAIRGGQVAKLAEELNLPTESPNPDGSWVYFDDKVFGLPKNAILGIPAELKSEDIERAIGLAGIKQALELDSMPVGELPRDLAGLVRTRMGEQVLNRLVSPIAGGIHSADPSLLAADVVIPGIIEAVKTNGSLQGAIKQLRAPGSPIATCSGGMFQLPKALKKAIEDAGGQIWTRVSTEKINRISNKWLIPAAETVAGDNPAVAPRPLGKARPIKTSRVIIACSASSARELLNQVIQVGQHKVDLGSPIAHLTLALQANALDIRPRGTGMLVAAGTKSVKAKALTHLTAKWDWLGKIVPSGFHILRISYGRSGEPYPQPDLNSGLVDASRLLGVELEPKQVIAQKIIRWDGTLAPLTPATRDWTKGLVEQVSGIPGLGLCGAWVSGTGLAALVPYARKIAKDLV